MWGGGGGSTEKMSVYDMKDQWYVFNALVIYREHFIVSKAFGKIKAKLRFLNNADLWNENEHI